MKERMVGALARFGFRIVREDPQSPYVSYQNFVHLTEAYEQCANELAGEVVIPLRGRRPELLARLQGTPPGEAYFIIEALVRTAGVEGDVCEFGVAQGETSALIANEIRDTTKLFHLFDSFEGLSRPSEKDKLQDDVSSLGSIEAYAGAMAYPERRVISRFESIGFEPSRYVVHKGLIDDTLSRSGSLPHSVSFAFVDFDLYEPITMALKFLDDVTSPGSMIIVDDYDHFSTGAKAAVDEFITQNSAREGVYRLDVPNQRFGHFAVLSRLVGERSML